MKIVRFHRLGAGLQSQERFHRYRETIRRACFQSVKALKNGKDAAEVACIAVAVLEVIDEQRQFVHIEKENFAFLLRIVR